MSLADRQMHGEAVGCVIHPSPLPKWQACQSSDSSWMGPAVSRLGKEERRHATTCARQGGRASGACSAAPAHGGVPP